MRKFFLLFIVIIAFAEENYYLDDIDSKEAYEKQKNGAIIIDVRTPTEFLYTGHGAGHINIPLAYLDVKPKALKYRVNLAKLELKKGEAHRAIKIYDMAHIDNKDFLKEVKEAVGTDIEQEVIFICHQGTRSKIAANKLANLGYENVYNVAEGFSYGWEVIGLPSGGMN